MLNPPPPHTHNEGPEVIIKSANNVHLPMRFFSYNMITFRPHQLIIV
jgi:hypothetical protein